ncbi:MAG: hypothetical protein ACRDTR_01690 [Rubrobacter sp.]
MTDRDPCRDNRRLCAERYPAGDGALKLQYLNNVEIERSDVSTASDFGRELLDLIFDQKEARS